MPAAKTPRPARFDAHVRARQALLVRIVNRAYEWGMEWAGAADSHATAAAKLAAYSATPWRHPAMTQRLNGMPVAPRKHIATDTIHAIMCTRLS